MGTFATPDHKSRADAASWVARRLQDGATREQILLELRQDGVAPNDGEDVYRRVRVSFQSLRVPRADALVRVAVLLPPTVVLCSWLWWSVKPEPPEGESVFVITATLLAAATIGMLIAFATAIGSGLGRNWRIGLVAIGADVVAMVGPSKLVTASGPGVALTVAELPLALLLTWWATTCIPRPHYALSVNQKGTFRWSRSSDNPSPWSRVFDRRTPWHDPQTSLYEMGVRPTANSSR